MDWVFENIQILVAVAATLAYWLSQRREARRAAESEPPPAEVGPATPPEYEERPVLVPDDLRRRILEQLGIPQPEAAPEPPPMPEPVLPPPLPDLPRVAAPVKPAATRPVLRAGFNHRTAGLRTALQARGKVREAILLREILGPPVGLRPEGHPAR